MKRLIACFLILCLLLPAFSFAEDADKSALSLYEAPFILLVEQLDEVPEGYTGIYSAADLQNIKDNPEGKYILMDNIILNGSDLRTVSFKGELEGNGYTISGLDLKIALNPRDTYYVGFFGWVRDASIRNLRLEGKIRILDNGFKTECRAYAGGLAGRVFGSSTIYNCVVDVDLTYDDAVKNYLTGYYGGVTGALDCDKGASISYCRNMGVVFGPEYVGGIVGYLGATQMGSPVKPAIHACYNNGVVDALGRSAGGIVGESANNTSPGNKSIVISSCANHGEVFALYSAGGILGRADTRDAVGYTCIEDCINLGTIATRDAPVSPTAGIVGYGDCYVTRCVNYSKVLGNPDSGINTDVSEASFLQDNYYLDTVDYACLSTDRHLEITEGKLTAEEMKLQDSFPALDFENVWDLNEGMEYPYPKPLAAESLAQKFEQLRSMFPDGKYWNHVGISYEEYAANRDKYNATCTDYPCDTAENLPGRHNHGNCAITTGKCGCNTYDGSLQCQGFGRYIGQFLMGVSTREWKEIITYSNIDSVKNQLQPGDFIRFGTNENGHTAIVVSADENGVCLLECNYTKINTGKNCQIDWTGQLSWDSIQKRFGSKSNQGYVLRYQK